MNADNLDSLTERVLGAVFEVSNTLGAGFLEKVYHARSSENSACGASRRPQKLPFLVLELKCVERLAGEHTAQCFNYLRASDRTVCLLVNFQKLRLFQDRILVAASVPKMRIHDPRHFAVAILLAPGVDARKISELLGHSSVAFTLQVYGHLMEETKRETASRMDAALAP